MIKLQNLQSVKLEDKMIPKSLHVRVWKVITVAYFPCHSESRIQRLSTTMKIANEDIR
jgi:hypothetical protein